MEDHARSDAQIIAASLDDPEAFAALYDRHAGLLFRYLIGPSASSSVGRPGWTVTRSGGRWPGSSTATAS